MGIKKTIALLSGLFIGLVAWTQCYDARVAAVDILHYDFFVSISDSSDRIEGLAKVKLELKQAVDHVVLDLVAPRDGKGMAVKSVHEIHFGDLDFKHSGELLEIALGARIPIGTNLELIVTYEGIPADGLIISKNERDGRSFFGDNWPNRAHHWLPTVDHPSEKATVDFEITAPAHYEIVANGMLVDQRVLPNGTQVSHWRNEEPLPTKVMVFGAADFAIQNIGDVNGIPVSTWVFVKDEENGFHDYALGKGILRWYMQQIGPYPWEKLANVQSRTRYGGMENASCIFYADNSVTGDGSCEALMAHEIAHQWFGNSASEAEWHHIWLSEGFATYLTHVYFESVHGPDIFQKRLETDRRQIVNWGPTWDLAVVDPQITDLNQLLNTNSYQKGSWVLHMLREKIGDTHFFNGLRTYYSRFKFSNALTSDLQKVMEETSGQDLNVFFQQWLFRPGFPKLDVMWFWKKSKKTLTVTISQTQAGDAFEFPLEIAALDAEGNVLQTINQNVSGKMSKATFTLPSSPAKLVLDPQVKLLYAGKSRMK